MRDPASPFGQVNIPLRFQNALLVDERDILFTVHDISIMAKSQNGYTIAVMIACTVAKEIEEQMTYPGEIKVTVLREVRATATAK